jgi:hypothetical protein
VGSTAGRIRPRPGGQIETEAVDMHVDHPPTLGVNEQVEVYGLRALCAVVAQPESELGGVQVGR